MKGLDESGEEANNDSTDEMRERLEHLQERLDQLSLETGDGYHALRNQRRLKVYLEHLVETLEERVGGSWPNPPQLEGRGG